ncbi:ABC transporter substrate-binding protein [Gordoniibacillus kamchatkensis]|uniref:ABC transporter substrate-binding protein n=1 Tax=Gordoniibacillus kamchatkensis TaxID=1590651 RepID=UPI0006967DB9|nr:ABC transporter substrate-binding protein [Paenibacillus sp. VKM B-2647]
MKKWWLIMVALMIVLAGCSGTGTGSTGGSGGTGGASGTSGTGGTKDGPGPAKDALVVGQDIDAGTLDPQKQGKMPDMNILINIFDTLVTRDADNKLAPALATEWKAIDDTTWQFKLREGVKFQDGEPFNADVVKYSIDRLKNPETKSPIVELNSVKEVKVVDPTTVNIITDGPDPILPNKLTLFGGVMVPPNYIKEKGDDNFAKNPVGTGPFKFVSWQKDNKVVMDANPDYWRGAPKVKHLTFKIIPNAADMVAALKTGEIDIAAAGVTADVADQLKGSPDIDVVGSPWIRTFYVSLDAQNGPLAKKEVRQALNYAVDVKTMIDTVLGGHASRVSTLIPKQNFGYDASVAPYEYNPDKAKQLLAQAGYPQGFTIQFDAGNQDSNIVQIISDMLGKVGVKVQANLVDSKTLSANIAAKKVAPLYYIGNTGWTMDAMSNFQSYIKSDRRYNRWKNDEADKLVDIEEKSLDPKQRQEAFTKLQQLLKEEAPFIYLYQLDNLYGMRKNVQWKPNPIGVLSMYNASFK